MVTLQKEVADVNKQIAEAERMLKFADPGEHTPSSFLCTPVDSQHCLLKPHNLRMGGRKSMVYPHVLVDVLLCQKD